MISRADQQFLRKMSAGNELDEMFLEHVCKYEKTQKYVAEQFEKGHRVPFSREVVSGDGTVTTRLRFSSDVDVAMFFLASLGEPCTVYREKDSDMWFAQIGAAKKIILIESLDLAEAVSKATLLYTRKFAVI